MNVLLRYIGGRQNSNEVWDRKKYSFNKENDFTCEVPQKLANWIFQYAQGQYQVIPTKIIEKEVIKEVERSLKCSECDFVAKSEQGLLVHSKKHKKEVAK